MYAFFTFITAGCTIGTYGAYVCAVYAHVRRRARACARTRVCTPFNVCTVCTVFITILFIIG
jgi:hypothetical protein